MDFSKLNVLVVDDFVGMRSIVKKIIRSAGITSIVDATDGLDAWEKLEAARAENLPFDVVFLDVNMPRMNGLELLDKCRESGLHKDLYVIMTSGEREQRTIVAALSKGAKDYILKPYTIDVVTSKLSNIPKLKKAA